MGMAMVGAGRGGTRGCRGANFRRPWVVSALRSPPVAALSTPFDEEAVGAGADLGPQPPDGAEDLPVDLQREGLVRLDLDGAGGPMGDARVRQVRALRQSFAHTSALARLE